jgi:predicted Ser/Thr protein kinase
VFFRFISLVILVSSWVSVGFASEVQNKCLVALKSFNPEASAAMESGKKMTSLRTAALAERHSLLELIPDENGNSLITKAPTIAMNAAQRHIYLAMSAGMKEIFDPRGSGPLFRWSLLSGGDQFGEKRIIGHFKTLDGMVARWREQAKGTEQIGVVLLVGSRGSGKSATLKILREKFEAASLKFPEHFEYSFRFVNLKEIEGVRNLLPSENGVILDDSLALPFYTNPIGLLPPALQDATLKSADKIVNEKIGLSPLPDLRLAKPIQHVRDQIIDHYSKKLGRALEEYEEVEYLAKHVEVTRVIADESYFPLLNAQPKDARMGAIFMSAHPIFSTIYGSGHPWAYNYGLLLRGNGFGVQLEEFLKNEEYLTRVFLTFFQDKMVSIDGSNSVPWDGVIYVVTNPADIEKVRKKDPDSPLTDRLTALPMDLELFPDQILKLLMLNIKGMNAKKLGDDSAPWTAVKPSNLDELIPEPNLLQPAVLPEGRFVTSIMDGQDRIWIAPHALKLLAYVTALTRYEFDQTKIPNADEFPTIISKEFWSEVTRLKAMLRQTEPNLPKMRHMFMLSDAAGEGRFGLTTRDLEKIWPKLLNEARKSAMKKTITPQLVERVLVDFLSEDENLKSETELRAKALMYISLVKKDFIIPAVIQDLMTALSGAQGADISAQYWEFVSEIQAIGENERADRYISLIDNTEKPLNRGRVMEIMSLYQRRTQRTVNARELQSMLYGFMRSQPSRPADWWKTAPKDDDLATVISEYLLRQQAKGNEASLNRALMISRNGVDAAQNDEERNTFNQFMKILDTNYGYNPTSVRFALELWQANQQGNVPGR